MPTARVVFTPSGLEGTVDLGSTVLDAARRLGVDLDTVCGGRGICGHCQVVPASGTFAKWAIDAQPLSTPDGDEIDYRGKRALGAGRRLGCMARICGDTVIDVPADSQVHRQVVRKHVDLGDLHIDPLDHLFYVEVAPATLEDEPRSAAEQIIDALRLQHASLADASLRLSNRLLNRVHKALAAQSGAVTVAVRRGEITALLPGFVETGYGFAVDVGSTTIAAHLCDLTTGEVLASRGRMNPQIRFGEDLMSRVSYVMMNPGGEIELTGAIRTALGELADELLVETGVDRSHVLDFVVVGNPIMHHLVLGIDPTPLGLAPFVLATADAVESRAAEIALDLPNAALYLLPCIAGHVGADTAGAILNEGPHRSEHMQLLVDVGTNAEIVLGSRDGSWAASSPTGPAFEGAQISCGQRATVGAIERVRIDRSTLEPRVKVIGCDLWSDDPGFTEATADIDISGICGSGIIEVIAEAYLSGIVDHDGTINGDLAAVSPRIVADGRTFSYVFFERGGTRLMLTQNDVRAIQLAKAALRAGIDLLLEKAAIPHLTRPHSQAGERGEPSVADIRLAGAFGAHIDPLYALVLGLVPDCPVEGVRSVGNAAGNGAVRALLSAEQRTEIEIAVATVTKIETATEPRFQELFVDAMAFPHATAPTPNLARLVELPARRERTDSGDGRRRRSRDRDRTPPQGDTP